MAFTRSAVRSRLAPPTFADFGRFGSQAKHDSPAKRAKAAAPKGAGERVKYAYILQSTVGEHFCVGAQL
jgi:hypothetical protein